MWENIENKCKFGKHGGDWFKNTGITYASNSTNFEEIQFRTVAYVDMLYA
jgi:hypothetical protein